MIERLVTMSNQRGMLDLLTWCEASPVSRAAAMILGTQEACHICTGFPVAGKPETDGPAGSVVLANGLARMGRRVRVVSWSGVLAMIRPLLHEAVEEIAVPVGVVASPLPPALTITVELCGRTRSGSYLNMRGQAVEADAPWLEEPLGFNADISIGDGGNEFGMGSAPDWWFAKYGVQPPVSTCDVLLPCEVSNWGALALVAQLSRAGDQTLVPTPEGYQDILQHLAQAGAVDGVSGRASATEDGFAPAATASVVSALQRWLHDSAYGA